MMNPVAIIALLRSMLGNQSVSKRAVRVPGLWYPFSDKRIAAGSALASGRLYFYPVWLEQPIRITDIAFRISTLAASGNVRVAIYASDPLTQRPSGAPAVSGSAQSTAAASQMTETLGAAVTLPAGLYFVACMADTTAGGTVVLAAHDVGDNLGSLMGTTTAAEAQMSNTVGIGGYYVTNTYANGFPTINPASPPTYTAVSTGALPVIVYKQGVWP